MVNHAPLLLLEIHLRSRFEPGIHHVQGFQPLSLGDRAMRFPLVRVGVIGGANLAILAVPNLTPSLR